MRVNGGCKSYFLRLNSALKCRSANIIAAAIIAIMMLALTCMMYVSRAIHATATVAVTTRANMEAAHITELDLPHVFSFPAYQVPISVKWNKINISLTRNSAKTYQFGVNVYGWMRGDFGGGTTARAVVTTLSSDPSSSSSSSSRISHSIPLTTVDIGGATVS